jgi:hypothetical protein
MPPGGMVMGLKFLLISGESVAVCWRGLLSSEAAKTGSGDRIGIRKPARIIKTTIKYGAKA